MARMKKATAGGGWSKLAALLPGWVVGRRGDARAPDSASHARPASERPELRALSDAFARRGYQPSHGDGGGADLVLRKGGITFLVHCGQWQSLKVGSPVLRELDRLMLARGAGGGFVVTLGRYTTEAVEFAAERNIKLIDGARLAELLKLAPSAPMAAPDHAGAKAPALPHCPLCGAAMKLRLGAGRGAHAGAKFWACATYPACSGSRSLQI